MSQSELARRSGVSVSQIARIERGERGLTPKTARRLAPHLRYRNESVAEVLRALGIEHVPATDEEPLADTSHRERLIAVLADLGFNPTRQKFLADVVEDYRKLELSSSEQ